uniref:Mitochondrial transcription rescue factor 1 C-terminal domain-containing protein n=1 Tax=Culex tarsalis TaxID=7177 RepID=A0A1Q3G409_CULTA
MSFIVRNTLNRNIFRLFKTNFPSTSYCCLQNSLKSIRIERNFTMLTESSNTLHNQLVWQQNQLSRGKSKKANRNQQGHRQDEEEDDDDDDDKDLDEFDELLTDKNAKVVKTSVGSLRADLIVKAGLGIARNKVETLFYESKIRVNGKKLLKKSAQLDVGDEVDVVKGPSPTNPDHLIVSRVEILAANPKSESIGVSLRRHKSLIIENYESDAVIGDR